VKFFTDIADFSKSNVSHSCVYIGQNAVTDKYEILCKRIE